MRETLTSFFALTKRIPIVRYENFKQKNVSVRFLEGSVTKDWSHLTIIAMRITRNSRGVGGFMG